MTSEVPESSQTPVMSESTSRKPKETPTKIASQCEESHGGASEELSSHEEPLSDDVMESEGEDEDEELYDEFRRAPLPTPDTIRSKVRKLITDKGLKDNEIKALIGLESVEAWPGRAWNKFMYGEYKNQSWAYSNDAFRKAAFFFFKEKRLGKNGKLAVMVKANSKNALPDLANIRTDGKTYLTPAECRKSVLAIFKKFNLTMKKLAKMIDEPEVMVSRFMADGGEFGGNGLVVYHTLADFCEKVRIATRTTKSRKRKAIEAGGRDTAYLKGKGKE